MYLPIISFHGIKERLENDYDHRDLLIKTIIIRFDVSIGIPLE